MPADGAEVLGQLALDELVVDLLRPRLGEHALREVDAHEPARIGREQRAAQPGAAAGVEHVELFDGLQRPTSRQHLGDERRRSVQQLGELGVEAPGEAVERRLDECVGGPRRHVASRAGGEHVARDGIVRLLRQPLLEHLDRLVDVAERAMRERQQPAGFGMLRPAA